MILIFFISILYDDRREKAANEFIRGYYGHHNFWCVINMNLFMVQKNRINAYMEDWFEVNKMNVVREILTILEVFYSTENMHTHNHAMT